MLVVNELVTLSQLGEVPGAGGFRELVVVIGGTDEAGVVIGWVDEIEELELLIDCVDNEPLKRVEDRLYSEEELVCCLLGLLRGLLGTVGLGSVDV